MVEANRDGKGNIKTASGQLYDNPPSEIRIPGGFFPHAGFKDGLWINFQAKELNEFYTAGRGGTLSLGQTKTTFQFLAPTEIVELHNHDWEEYSSIQSRLLELVSKGKTFVEQGGAIADLAIAEGRKFIQNPTAGGALQSLYNLGNEGKIPVPERKVDTPLRYKNSQRRQYQMEFTLAESGDPGEMATAVKLFEKFCAPNETTDVVDIKFPHIFKVWTEPEGLILLEHAAVTSMQPTWMHPYIQGYPQRCNLTISITDMSPLFADTITEGTIINVRPDTSEDASAQNIRGV
jgi:hypothetical protein